MATWNNSDGLFIRYGSDEAKPSRFGEYNFGTPHAVLEIDLFWSDLPAFGATDPVILARNVRIPFEKIYIEKVEIVTQVDWDSATDNFTLDIGLYDTDGTTVYDANGLVDAITQAELNTGGTNVAGWVGSAVDTVISNTTPLLLQINVDTAQPTAGHSLIRIYYTVVNHTADTLGDVLT